MSDPGAVLLVDDNENTRYVFSTWLHRAGFAVDEACTGGEAMSALTRRRYDVVILDVNLPDMSGLSICDAIKGDPTTEAIPVLHVSATAVQTSDRSVGLRRGADAYLVEPLEREELLATVGALLRYAKARRRAETLAARLTVLLEASLGLNAAEDVETLTAVVAATAAQLGARPVAAAAVTVTGGLVSVIDDSGDAAPVVVSAEEFGALQRTPAQTLEAIAPHGISVTGELKVLVGRDRNQRTAGLLIAEAWGEEADGLETVLQQLVQTVAVAADNLALLAREHDIAVTLQKSLLPHVPHIPWLDIAVRYIPSTAQNEVGGDFYDVIPLDEDLVALVIGDVQGHSLEAATVMASLRSSLSAYLIAGRAPGKALELLNEVLLRSHSEMIATVCCMILRRDGHALIANAGHLPPIVNGPSGPRIITATGTLLGVEHSIDELALQLAGGSTVVMYTDGLVEQRRGSVADGMNRAIATVGAAGGDVEAICDRLIADVAPTSTTGDDIAVLAVHLRSDPAQVAHGEAAAGPRQ